LPQRYRVFKENHWYYIILKGQRLQPLFFSPDDRIKYIKTLDYHLFKNGGKLGAFVLMNCYVYLLLKQGKTPLNNIYHRVNCGYAKYFNKKRETNGHVFEGRPFCKIILDDRYLKNIIEMIHGYPVKKGISESSKDYKWSSWNWYEGNNLWADLKSFESCFSESMECVRGNMPGGASYIGSKEQWEETEKRKEGRRAGAYREKRGRKSMERIANDVCRGTSYKVQDLLSSSRRRELSRLRHMAMARMYDEGYGYSETGRYFNRTFRIVEKAHRKYGNSNKS